jgi:hypothetical protein
MSTKIQDLLQKMWIDYCLLNPKAKNIFDFFQSQGEVVLNDHIALRTFNLPEVGLKAQAAVFEKYGYVAKGEYHFPDKKLFALHFEHPDTALPKIFISELLLEKMSNFVRETLVACAKHVSLAQTQSDDFSMMGRPWPMSYSTYQALAKESEYASWVAAFGFRPNHFTVNVNALKKFQDLGQLNSTLEAQGHKLNASGGVIKGSPEVCLEQSSTMAADIPVQFSDGLHAIPGCYYEFAKRYPLPSGQLYQGFVASSADKIFESTNRL